jgi:type I restriction enzyme S subunit
MSEWKEYKLKEVIEKFIDYRGKTPTKTKIGVPLITAKIIKDGRILEPKEFIAKVNYDKWMTRGYPEINDVVLTTEAPLGEVALLKNKNVALAQRIIILRGKKERCDNAFLKYYLQSSIGQATLQSRAQGSTVEGIKSAELREMEVILPDLPEQYSIASILSSLDDKIDLLHRQNKTLEALAETLFRQWFVEEAEEGWGTTSLFDVIEIVGGGTPKTEVAEYWNGSVKWISARDITPNHKGFITETEKTITALGLEKSSTKILPKYSMVISARGTVGKYCILSESMAFSQSNYGIKPKIKDCYFFTYLLIAYSVDELQAAAYGSVFDTITTNTFKEHKLNIPPDSEIESFEQSVKPYFEKILRNNNQICTLTRLRDTLLPKLMSGEVRVEYENN